MKLGLESAGDAMESAGGMMEGMMSGNMDMGSMMGGMAKRMNDPERRKRHMAMAQRELKIDGAFKELEGLLKGYCATIPEVK